MSKFLQPRDYDITTLGKRQKCIPGKEPVLNRSGEVIQVCDPDLDDKALKYVSKAVTSTWISSRGSFLTAFETKFAEKVGASFGVAVNSGTSALYLALAAYGLEEGDEVIVPSFTMISTAFAVTYLGAIPVFVDCSENYQINPELIEQAITPKTKIIMPVHIYGHPCDSDAIEAIAEKHNLAVIYDAAEAHGALYKEKPIGNRGLASCYSFYGNKIITTGEGGMVVSDNKEFMDIVRNLKDVSFSPERHFWHKRLGYNFRMTNLAAAVGVAQVERFDELVQAHISNAEYYNEGLKNVKGLRLPPQEEWAKNVYWMYGMSVLPEFGGTRDELRKFMADKGIETRTFFVPMHLQPYYFKPETDKKLPVSEKLSEQGLYIPSSSTLTAQQKDKVIEAIKDASKFFHS